MTEPWIGVDLDGTLAQYDGWKGEDHIGEPIPAMVDRVKAALAAGKQVKIFTARVATPNLVQKTLIALKIAEWCLKHIGTRLAVTSEKDFGMVELWDDRCKQVLPNTGEFLEDAHAAAVARIEYLEQRLTKLQTSRKGELEAELERLRQAALALYDAGCWRLEDVMDVDEKKLWENLRDALGLAPGTATVKGVGA